MHPVDIRINDDLSSIYAMLHMLTENLSPTLAVAVLSLAAVYTIKWIVEKRRRINIFKEHGIPGPPPHFIRGNLTSFGDIVIVSEWLIKYGNVFGYFLGGRPVLIVKDLDILKHVFIKNFSNFKDRPEAVIQVKPFCYGLAMINGPRWKETRSILSPTFSGKKMKLMSHLMHESVTTFLEIIGEKCEAGESFDIYAMGQGLTMDVIGKCALALKVNCQRDPNDKLLTASRDFIRFSDNPAIKLALLFPGIAKLMELMNNYLTAGQMTNLIVDNLRKVISYRRKNPNKRFVDMLQLMLDAAELDENDIRLDNNSTSKSLTDDEIVGNGMTFVIAGFETTANALGYTFYLLAKYEEVQDKLRSELNDFYAQHPENPYDVVVGVDYLDQVLNESMRIYPPVVTFVSRHCASTITINGLTIPQGIDVQAPVYQIHHDPELWPNPEVFDPSRFAPENKDGIHPMAFIPFGAGPRNCVGMRFALMEAKMAIARVISNYKLVFCDETEDPLTIIIPTVTANPANGVILKATRV